MPHGDHIERYHGGHGWTGGGTLSSRGVGGWPYRYGPYGPYGYGVGGYGISSGFLLPGDIGYGSFRPHIYGAGIYPNSYAYPATTAVVVKDDDSEKMPRDKKIAIFVGIACAIFILLFIILAVVLSKRR